MIHVDYIMRGCGRYNAFPKCTAHLGSDLSSEKDRLKYDLSIGT
jgi:hypothetical protein